MEYRTAFEYVLESISKKCLIDKIEVTEEIITVYNRTKQKPNDREALDESIRKVLLRLELEKDLSQKSDRRKSFYNFSPNLSSKPIYHFKDEQTTEKLHKMLNENFVYYTLNPKQRRNFVKALEMRKINAGYKLIEENTEGTGMYLIDSGLFSVSRRGEFITTIKPGDLFGEYAIIYNTLRNATVTSTTEAVVWFISKENYVTISQIYMYKNWSLLYKVLEDIPEYKHLNPNEKKIKANAEFIYLHPNSQVVIRNRYFIVTSNGSIETNEKKDVGSGNILIEDFVTLTELEGFFINRGE